MNDMRMKYEYKFKTKGKYSRGILHTSHKIFGKQKLRRNYQID